MFICLYFCNKGSEIYLFYIYSILEMTHLCTNVVLAILTPSRITVMLDASTMLFSFCHTGLLSNLQNYPPMRPLIWCTSLAGVITGLCRPPGLSRLWAAIQCSWWWSLMGKMCEDRMDVRLGMRAELHQQHLSKVHHSKTGIKTEHILVDYDVGQSSKKDFDVANNYRLVFIPFLFVL